MLKKKENYFLSIPVLYSIVYTVIFHIYTFFFEFPLFGSTLASWIPLNFRLCPCNSEPHTRPDSLQIDLIQYMHVHW